MASPSSAQDNALSQSAEHLAPWLAAPILIGVLDVAVVVSGAELSLALRSVMILCLCGSIAVACVVAARSSRVADDLGREERERPSRHELAGADDFSRRKEVGPAAYLASMERW